MVLTTFSFAKNPFTIATALCQVPKPSGANINATSPPIIAKNELSMFSTNPRFLFSTPVFDKSHTSTTTRKITVPAFITKALQRE